MEFSADTKSLAEALDQVEEAVKEEHDPHPDPCPHRSNRQRASAGGDGPRSWHLTFCPAQVKVPGSVAAPARRFLGIVRSLSEAEVHVRALENHWLQVSAGRSVFKLAALAKDNFPVLTDVPKALAEAPAGLLAGLIDRTAFAIQTRSRATR